MNDQSGAIGLNVTIVADSHMKHVSWHGFLIKIKSCIFNLLVYSAAYMVEPSQDWFDAIAEGTVRHACTVCWLASPRTVADYGPGAGNTYSY